MEGWYTQLKRSTLKELLEVRGGTASSKAKRVIIAELMELDRENLVAASPIVRENETPINREIRERLALFGPNPPPEIIMQVIKNVTENANAREERELQLRLAENQRTAAISPNGGNSTVDLRKIPFSAFKSFNETESEIDGYLADFERQCALHKVAADEWVPILAGKLSGKAADAFRAVPDQEIHSYERVKEALLARYAVTPEAYRRKFRESRKVDRDSYTEWACRLQLSASNWITSCQATTVDDILQLILLEQFYNHIQTDVKEWVRDRRPLSLPEAAKLADEYTDTRKAECATPRTQPLRTETPPQPAVTRYQPPSRPVTTNPRRPNNNEPRCFRCKQLGHLRNNCPLEAPRSNWTRPGFSNPQAAAHCVDYPVSSAWDARELSQEEPLGALHEAHLVQSPITDNRKHHCQLVMVNGKTARGLRDSGATITLVQRHLIENSEQPGKSVAVRVAGGAIYRIPTAQVHLDWGAGAGNINVGVMKDLPAEVVLGNDIGPLTSSFMPTPTQDAQAATNWTRPGFSNPQAAAQLVDYPLSSAWDARELSREEPLGTSLFSNYKPTTESKPVFGSRFANGPPASVSLITEVSSLTAEMNGEMSLFTSSPTPSKSGSSREYNKQLMSLNYALRDWIVKHVNATPLCDLTPIFRDYEKHLANLEQKYHPGKQNGNASGLSRQTDLLLE